MGIQYDEYSIPWIDDVVRFDCAKPLTFWLGNFCLAIFVIFKDVNVEFVCFSGTANNSRNIKTSFVAVGQFVGIEL